MWQASFPKLSPQPAIHCGHIVSAGSLLAEISSVFPLNYHKIGLKKESTNQRKCFGFYERFVQVNSCRWVMVFVGTNKKQLLFIFIQEMLVKQQGVNFQRAFQGS